VTALAVSEDGRTVAVGEYGGAISIWDVATAAVRHRLTHSGIVTALALTPAADRVVAGGERSLTVYPLPPETPDEPVARLVTPYRVTAAAVNPAMPRYVLFGTAAGQVAYVRLPDAPPSHEAVRGS
jgi:WD40 repeat protein